MEFYRTGRKERHASRRASSWRCSASSPARSSCCASSAIPTTVPAGTAYRISDVELASRLSFFLWSSIPDDELLTLAAQRPAARARGARAAGAAHAARPAGDVRWWTTSPAQWLQLRNLQRVTPGQRSLSRVRRQPAQSFRREVELLFGGDHARGPQRARSADGRLHVRRRAAGQALRHPERLRQPVPPRRR